MRAVASGEIKRKGLSPGKAQEYVTGYGTANLPERVGAKVTRKVTRVRKVKRRGRRTR
jgi:hypothetical protein